MLISGTLGNNHTTMTPEQELYQKVLKNLKGHVVRIENVAEAGIPDVNICYFGIDVWVETKVAKMRQVMLRPEQHAWMTRRAVAGGCCFVVSKIPEAPVLHIWQYPKIEVVPCGKYARIVNPPHWEIDSQVLQLQKVLFPMI
jgi:hypothetical protein